MIVVINTIAGSTGIVAGIGRWIGCLPIPSIRGSISRSAWNIRRPLSIPTTLGAAASAPAIAAATTLAFFAAAAATTLVLFAAFATPFAPAGAPSSTTHRMALGGDGGIVINPCLR